MVGKAKVLDSFGRSMTNFPYTQESVSQGIDTPPDPDPAQISAQKANTTNDFSTTQRRGDNVVAPEEEHETADIIEQRQNFILYQLRLGHVVEQRRATEEVRRIVRTNIFPHCKFANNEACFEYVPERIASDPLRGCFFRAIKKEYDNDIGHEPRTWWISMIKVVRTTICKMRGSASSMLKKVVEGTYNSTVEGCFPGYRVNWTLILLLFCLLSTPNLRVIQRQCQPHSA